MSLREEISSSGERKVSTLKTFARVTEKFSKLPTEETWTFCDTKMEQFAMPTIEDGESWPCWGIPKDIFTGLSPVAVSIGCEVRAQNGIDNSSAVNINVGPDQAGEVKTQRTQSQQAVLVLDIDHDGGRKRPVRLFDISRNQSTAVEGKSFSKPVEFVEIGYRKPDGSITRKTEKNGQETQASIIKFGESQRKFMLIKTPGYYGAGERELLYVLAEVQE